MSGRQRAIRAVIGLVVTIAGVVALGYLAPVSGAAWIKAIHVMAVISWMAGMLYLPRLFVYHSAATPGSETSETFKVMERRLLEYIINPAMIVSWVAGLWLAWVVFPLPGRMAARQAGARPWPVRRARHVQRRCQGIRGRPQYPHPRPIGGR